MGNQKPYIKEEQTTQFVLFLLTIDNGQKKKDKQRYINYTYKTKDRVTRTSLKTGDELRFSGRVSSSCSTNGTRCNLFQTFGSFLFVNI